MKLWDTSEDLRLVLTPEIREDKLVGGHNIDVAEASSTATEGTLYIQSLDGQKQIIADYIQEFLTAYAEQNPDDSNASIVYSRPIVVEIAVALVIVMNWLGTNAARTKLMMTKFSSYKW